MHWKVAGFLVRAYGLGCGLNPWWWGTQEAADQCFTLTSIFFPSSLKKSIKNLKNNTIMGIWWHKSWGMDRDSSLGEGRVRTYRLKRKFLICFKTVWEGGEPVEMKQDCAGADNYWSWVMGKHGLIIIWSLLKYMFDVYNKKWKKNAGKCDCLHSEHTSPKPSSCLRNSTHRDDVLFYNYKTSLGVPSTSLSTSVTFYREELLHTICTLQREAVTEHTRF